MSESTKIAIQLPSPALKKGESKIIALDENSKSINIQVASQKLVTKLCLNTSEGSIIIPFSNILRLESASNYTCLYTLDSKKYVFSKTIKKLIHLLPSGLFIRCHRSHFVNIDQIVSFKKGSLFLQSDIEIPIARQKYQEVVRSIKSFCVSF